MTRLLLTAASSLLYALAFPPWSLWPLAWVALVPLLLVFRGSSRAAAMAFAWTWTMLCCALLIPWFGTGISRYFDQPAAVGAAAFIGVPTFTGAVEYAAVAACYPFLSTAPPVLRPMVVAAAWVLAEIARVHLLSGNPWGLLPYSQLDAASLPQIADVTGMSGITFVVVTCNAAVAERWAARRAAPAIRRQATIALAVAAALVALGFAAGSLRLAAARSRVATAPPTHIAVVQGDVDVGTQWRPEFYGANLDVYLRLTAASERASPPAALVFWPENAMTFFVDAEPLYRTTIATVLAKTGTQLVAGGPRGDGGTEGPFHTSAFLIAPDGRVVAHYDKRLLIPFAERFPLLRTDFFLRRFARVRELAPGTAWTPLATVAGRAGVMICNEGLYPGAARAQVRAGAEYLVNLANDAWAGQAQCGMTALQMVRLRAIEQRRYVVRASTSGPSAIVDPLGRVLTELPPSTRGVVSGDIVPAATVTPYGRVGEWFAMACAAAVAGSLLRAARSAPSS